MWVGGHLHPAALSAAMATQLVGYDRWLHVIARSARFNANSLNVAKMAKKRR
jgi:hypothetical protein